MSYGTRVRDAEGRDLDAIAAIETTSFSDPWSRRAFQALLLREDADVFVAERDDAVAGYAVLWTTVDEAELANVAVAPAVRRQGVGADLVRHVLEAAQARGATSVFLEVRESNRAAARLYEAFGFEQLGVRRGYYRRPVEDARVMALRLAPSGDAEAPVPG